MRFIAASGPLGHRRRQPFVGAAIVATVLATVGACAAGGQSPGAAQVELSPAPGSASTAAPSTAPTATVPATPGVTITKVLTIVLENHGTDAVRAGMPDLMKLADTYGQTSRYRAETHPSLPNYLSMAGGSTFAVTDDAPPADHPVSGPSVFDLALAAGRTARTYAEGMPTNCALTKDGRYAVKHNPWAYFADASSRQACRVDDVPLGTHAAGPLTDDIAAGTLPEVGMVVPDLCNDAHDCPLATADAWVDAWVTQVQQGPDWRAGRLAVVVTFDEAERSSDNTVLTVVAAPSLDGQVVDDALTHASWTRWMSDLVGSPAPNDAHDAPSLGAAFGL
ncbi:alkaline phosphatase family protein [Pengzhenrongella phosphoraccumulans]|uniref:alkaline phosphatase family protein n=1 Tax=Pengzhenrongella phosphoraccumulans TaxID=3114394 RepID=UPI00388E660B